MTRPVFRKIVLGLALAPLALGLAACGKKDPADGGTSAPIAGEPVAKVAAPAGKTGKDGKKAKKSSVFAASARPWMRASGLS